jgi:hypothetical protein
LLDSSRNIPADKSKIKSVYINLKENGEADITLFTDLQLFAKGQWSAPADPSKGIPLKITGGIVDGPAKLSHGSNARIQSVPITCPSI